MMGLVAREACWPCIEWLLKLRFADEAKMEGKYVVVIDI